VLQIIPNLNSEIKDTRLLIKYQDKVATDKTGWRGNSLTRDPPD